MPQLSEKNARRRQSALQRYAILDTPKEDEFDDIVRFVAGVCETPVALVSLLDTTRQWFKAETGLGRSETPLSQSICVRAVNVGGFVEIRDTQLDPMCSVNELCHGAEAVRFYAGAPLVAPDGQRLGMLCVLDHHPRSLTPLQRRTIEVMAVQVMRLIELRGALARVDVLRREVDHRVKNSLASIAAVVRMQAARTDSAEVRAALGEVQSRLVAQAALHEQLVSGGDSERANLADYLDRLAAPLRTLLPEGVRLEVEAQPIELGSEQLGRVGLIVNEFVTNTGKYGFPADAVGAVTVTGAWLDDGTYRVACADDGQADESALAAARGSKGLGARIINAAAVSLGGASEWSLGGPGLRLEFVLEG
jgi:two-component sensor histidine kinase